MLRIIPTWQALQYVAYILFPGSQISIQETHIVVFEEINIEYRCDIKLYMKYGCI